MNIVIITGASSGIGREFALQMDAHFSNIDEFWLIARNRGRLESLAGQMKHDAQIFTLDITNSGKLDDLEEALSRQNAVVRILINCAGYGIMGELDQQDRDTVLGMIRLNCQALTEMTQRMLPYMRRGSRILQMASSAGFCGICRHKSLCAELFQSAAGRIEILRNLCHCRLSRAGGYAFF